MEKLYNSSEIRMELNIFFESISEKSPKEKFVIDKLKLYGLNLPRIEDYANFYEASTTGSLGIKDYLSTSIRGIMIPIDEENELHTIMVNNLKMDILANVNQLCIIVHFYPIKPLYKN